jgi:group I intron endonuclease
MGIYSITNKINGKRYIGKSENIKGRWKGHKSELRHNKHHCEHLQLAWNKYGEDSFVFEKICEVWDVNNLRKIEQTFIDLYKSYDGRFGYNEERYADERKIVSDKTRKKISENHWDCSGENNPMFGKRFSEETRKKMSEALKGKMAGENNPMFGKHHSEETKKKISEAILGEKNHNFGKHLMEETKKKLSEANKGKLPSEETRKKMSENHADFSGENNHSAKLTYEIVSKIREEYKKNDCSQVYLARKYGVEKSCVWSIVHNKSWIIKEDKNSGQQ